MFHQSERIYDLFYGDKDYAAESQMVRDLVAERLPGARSLLDVACGTGRHLEQFRRWYDVEGVDLDGVMLQVAAERLPGVNLHRLDMSDFQLGRTFDVVTCLFASIGYLLTAPAMARAVANMAHHVAPGGLLVVEPWMTPESFQPQFPGRILMHESETLQAVRVSVGRVVGRTSEIDFHYLVARPGRIEHMTETHTMGLFSINEYRGAFEAAGLVAEYEAHGLTGRGLWIAQRESTP